MGAAWGLPRKPCLNWSGALLAAELISHADDLIQAAVAFSGVPAFIELPDLAKLHQPADPLQAQLEALLR
jgi:hypothetical protein